ncbi:MAG: ATP-binding protein [Armatimonadota bacterium]
MIINSNLILPAEAGYVSLVRHMAVLILRELDVIEVDIGDIELVIGEVCSNVVVHAYDKPGVKYQVDFNFSAEKVLIVVKDDGSGLEGECGKTPEPLQIGGYGIWLVKNIADKVQFKCPDNAPGTQVQAEIDLHYNSAKARKYAKELDNASVGQLTVTAGG